MHSCTNGNVHHWTNRLIDDDDDNEDDDKL